MKIRPLLVGAFVALTSPAAAQQPAVIADLLRDITEVEQKLMGLAREMPASTYAWRPGDQARSVGEVFQHVAADNYLLAAAIGKAAPPSTGISPQDYNTAVAYERRQITRDAIIKDLEESLAHFKAAVGGTTETRLGTSVSVFGQTFTVQQLLIVATTHLHEHLGQAIAYARSNGIVPPWSRPGN